MWQLWNCIMAVYSFFLPHLFISNSVKAATHMVLLTSPRRCFNRQTSTESTNKLWERNGVNTFTLQSSTFVEFSWSISSRTLAEGAEDHLTVRTGGCWMAAELVISTGRKSPSAVYATSVVQLHADFFITNTNEWNTVRWYPRLFKWCRGISTVT